MSVMISEYLWQCGSGSIVPQAATVSMKSTEDDDEPKVIDLEAFNAPPEVLFI